MIAKVFFLINAFVLIVATIQANIAWQRRRRPVALPLFFISICLIVIAANHSLYYFFDYSFTPIKTEKTSIVGGLFSQSIWIWLIIELVLNKSIPKLGLLLIEPLIATIFLLTNEWHQLFYTEHTITTVSEIPRMIFDYGVIRKVHGLYLLILWISITGWAVYRQITKPRIPTSQIVIVIGLMVLASVQLPLYNSGFLAFKGVTFVGLLLIIWGLRYYKVLDFLPVARKQIVEDMAEGIALINDNKEIVDSNNSFSKILNISVPHEEPFMLLADLPSYLNKIHNYKQSESFKTTFTTLQGKEVEYKQSPILSSDGLQGSTIIIRDITEQSNLRKQKEFYTQQLEASKTSLERLDQMKSNFFSNVTHEFRTPLTLIQEPARRLIAHPDEQVRSNAKLINSNSNKLLDLVNQLLTLTRMDSGKVELNMSAGDLTVILREEFQKFLPRAAKEKLELSLKIDRNFPLISFDKQKIESVITNLISNAIKYSDEGKITVQLSIKEDIYTPIYQLQVEDTGRGISEEELPHIFDRFYQIDSTDTRRGEGTGIGLALVHELVKIMEGSISVSSELGAGSIFTVQLPLLKKAGKKHLSEATPELKIIHPEVPLIDITKATLETDEDLKIALIVEDNEELRSFMRSSMQSQFTIIEASNGVEGVEKARALLPDIIISDVMMPEKDGVSLLKEIKSDELTSHIPVVLLTAKSTIEDRLTGLRHGADDYISKPFQLEELILRTHNIIANRILATEKYIKALQQHPVELPHNTDDTNDFIRQFMLIIEAELDNDAMSIDDYADRMKISRSQLHRKIKSMTELTTTHFIRDYRLDRAMSMLRGKEGTVREISMKVGISNPKYFSSVFKAKFGLSPSEV